jgi:spectinomycin phosphotransferase
MLEPPELSEATIIAHVRAAYGLPLREVAFLPLGADQDTAVYRAVAEDGAMYFAKLRRGAFVAASVLIPHWLHNQGVAAIIPPLAARDGALWTHLASFTVILYPYVDGVDAHDVALSEPQWHTLGSTLRRLHEADVPAALRRDVPREDYSPHARRQVRGFLAQATREDFADPWAAGAARLLRKRAGEISDCVARAEALAGEVERLALPSCLCHSDIHAWNVLLDATGRLFVVDWDTLIYAPRERDLMFISGGIGGWGTPDEIAQFYRGYGETEVNPAALAYYRYDRIVQDIAAYCEALLLSDEGGADRPEMLRQLAGNFDPGGVLDIARATEGKAA